MTAVVVFDAIDVLVNEQSMILLVGEAVDVESTM